ncbi:potassium channel family protein [Dyella telluris]|uniref:Two pore domain potassium channel family protein n=1 Tax=Dyella telluris TaxID=2763498 RepID=A0A7G8Q503_9GAMM|nr:potassium channel family protein [Dyella telluris]QNK01861.1 two pore domain potassium channel family protein [Dyella telluris]
MRSSTSIRRDFALELWVGLKIIWPVLSALLLFVAIVGLVIAHLEGWSAGDGLYFSFVTGLTIGYGDMVPKRALSRLLAIAIGSVGVVLTGLIVSVGVAAFQRARNKDDP